MADTMTPWFSLTILPGQSVPVTLLQSPCFGNNKHRGSRSPASNICFVINVLIGISNYLVTAHFAADKRHDYNTYTDTWPPIYATTLLYVEIQNKSWMFCNIIEPFFSSPTKNFTYKFTYFRHCKKLKIIMKTKIIERI